ncbi:MAG: HAD-IIB family hydrolase [Thermoanaerobaculia bacterium]|jgi:mannosyl-3-phosphoglycerate phosphatase
MRRSWIVFTDLDGTLLDANDFGFAAALPAIRRLQAEGIPIVPVTSKTVAELIPLMERLGLEGPGIVESGSAIVAFEGGSWVVTPLGVPVEQIRSRVPAIEERSGARLALFSAMDDAEASRISGLSGDALGRARQRQFDEPFVLASGDIARVARAAGAVGLIVRDGARFHHLCGPVTKGDAVCRLLSTRGARPGVIALGDAPMDGDFLALADIAVIVRAPNGEASEALLSTVPHAVVTTAPGPAGWAEAILSILDDPTRIANEPARA